MYMLTDLQLQGLKNKCLSLINKAKDLDDFYDISDNIKVYVDDYKIKHLKKENSKKLENFIGNFNFDYKTNFILLNKLNIDGFRKACGDNFSSRDLFLKFDTLFSNNTKTTEVYFDNFSGLIVSFNVIESAILYLEYLNNEPNTDYLKNGCDDKFSNIFLKEFKKLKN